MCSILLEEVNNLKVTVITLQEKKETINISVLEDVCGLKAKVATLQEVCVDKQISVDSVNCNVDSYTAETQNWSDIVRRKTCQKGENKCDGGKGRGGRRVKDQRERIQINKQGSSKYNVSRSGKSEVRQSKSHSSHQFVSLPGKRKIWGTRKSCSSQSVKDNIVELIQVQGAVEVKRKYKLVNGHKTVKWWHVLSGDEDVIDKIEQEWCKVKAQTLWSIEPCLSYLDSTEISDKSDEHVGVITDTDTSSRNRSVRNVESALEQSSHSLQDVTLQSPQHNDLDNGNDSHF